PSHLRILSSLSRRPRRPVALGRLAREAGLTAAGLDGELARMEGQGYGLERGPRGIRLVAEPDRLYPERLMRGLETDRLGRELQSFQTIGSTNDRALQLGEKGAADGTVLVADRQTRGRGRRGRAWALAEDKGLAFSVILRPALPAAEAPGLTLAAAVAVARTLEEWKVRPRIKWPNDLFLGGRKVCGILTETRGREDKINFAVVGVGVNLNQAAGDFPPELRATATSLFRHRGIRVDRAAFFRRLLLHLEKAEGWVRRRQFHRVLAEWRRRSFLNGRQVRIREADRTLYGQVQGVDETGALLVRNDWGMVERVLAGDVELLRLSRRRPRPGIRKRGGA
ncbi:MAG TPA: biotin--[acetyl-CoA-carboxylase] ligase, partial [bacterium]|nr:biotin--[acetyl-CoA-carboxylase] ligase [bacterium]